MPQIVKLSDCDVEAPDDIDEDMLLLYMNTSIDALNYWYGYRPCTIKGGVLNRVQRCCLKRWVQNVATLLLALSKVSDKGIAQPPTLTHLVASNVDVLDACGKIETIPILPHSAASIVTDGSKLFPGVTKEHAILPRYRGNLHEYATLVVRQLRAGRVRLRFDIRAGGPCFFISKPGKDALRHLWNGHFLSDACAPAPAPRHLANPSAFVHLRATVDKPLFLSTRDCRSWFEQLKAPEAIRPYLGQQSLSCKNIIGVLGITLSELRDFVDEMPTPLSDEYLLSRRLFPISCTWPQGFSWSPFVAQKTLLNLAHLGGFGSERLLSPDKPPPDCISKGGSAIALIYDDVMHFTRDVSEGQRELDAVDAIYDQQGIQAAREKDQTLVHDGLACGVELSLVVLLLDRTYPSFDTPGTVLLNSRFAVVARLLRLCR